MSVTQIEFEVDGKKFFAKKPTAAQKQQAQRLHTQAFYQALNGGAMFKEEMYNLLKSRNIIDEVEMSIIRQKIEDLEKKLAAGGIELNEAKEIALDLRKTRNELLLKNLILSSFYSETVESQADAISSEYLTSVCICHQDGRAVCKDLTDFLNKQEQPEIIEGSIKFNELMYGSNKDYSKNLPENQFLIKYGFMNEDFEMLDENGTPIKNEIQNVEFSPFLKNGTPV